jgi:tetratricopeptide (TPR) repeat protein/pimeloyl-ACP methyl ester carboxylesterase
LSELIHLAGSTENAHTSVILIHGLGGHVTDTWRTSKGLETYLPHWLAEDVPGIAVYSVGYEVPEFKWSGSTMPLNDRAANILESLLTYPQLLEAQLILIGHSLGGLLIKQILLKADSQAQTNPDKERFLSKIKSVAFIATPHAGSDLATWMNWLRIIFRPSEATACLIRNDSNLRDINVRYRNWANPKKLVHLILTETKPTKIFFKVVEADSSDPGLLYGEPIPIDADHVSICKPADKESEIYRHILKFVRKPRTDFLGGERDKFEAILDRLDGVPRQALAVHLERLGARGDISVDDIPRHLERFADELLALREQWNKLSNADPEVSAVRRKADEKLEVGDLEGAKGLLSQERGRIRELRQERSREEAMLMADEAQIDLMQLNYRAAANKFGESAKLVDFDKDAAFQYLHKQAQSLDILGEEFGDNGALLEAINVCQTILLRRTRNQSPQDWAGAQYQLGLSLAKLGQRDIGIERLEAAVDAFEAALMVFTRDQEPMHWAGLQNNLGNTLNALGAKAGDTERLEQALEAFNATLSVWTQEKTPMEWAMAQNNLGSALFFLGREKKEPRFLTEALLAYELALLVWTRDLVPLDWAKTKNNIGNLKRWFGENEESTVSFEAAIEEFELALQVWTQDRVPMDWAKTQFNLGNTLLSLGMRTGIAERIETALKAFSSALLEWKRECVPLDWAATVGNIGRAFLFLAESNRDRSHAKMALHHYEAAYEVFSQGLHIQDAEIAKSMLVRTQNLVEQLRQDQELD